MLRIFVSVFISDFQFFTCLLSELCLLLPSCVWQETFSTFQWPLVCEHIWPIGALTVDLKVGKRKKQEYYDSDLWFHLFSGSISYQTSLSLWFPDPTGELTIVPATAEWPPILGSSKNTFCHWTFCLKADIIGFMLLLISHDFTVLSLTIQNK